MLAVNNTRRRSISAELIVTEAEKLGLKVEIINIPKNLFTIEGNGIKRHFKNVDGSLNTSYAFRVTKYKDYTYLLMDYYGVRVPQTKYIIRKYKDDYKKYLKNIKFPVVTKPVDGTHGDGVAVNINSMDELKDALNYSFGKDVTKVIIQEQIPGVDHRIVVVGGKMVAATLRVPPYVVGDAKKTVKELIDIENENPLRGKGNHFAAMSQIKVDEESLDCLSDQGVNLETILEEGKKVNIRKNANLSTGGLAIDVTDKVHPSVRDMCERGAKALTLELAGIDFITTDISKPIEETGGAIIEANHTPGLRMHHFPSEGNSRNVAREILKLSFNL